MTLLECQLIAKQWFRRYGVVGTVEAGKFLDKFGVCKYVHGSTRVVIQLHREYMEQAPRASVMETLLHEIAHALVGPGYGHGPVWQEMAKVVGCRPIRCGDAEESARLDSINKPKAKFSASCCGREWVAFRAPRNGNRYRCPSCKGTVSYSPIVNDKLSSIFRKGK